MQISIFGVNTVRFIAPRTVLARFFNGTLDPRKAEGCRHRLRVVLGIAAGATLCEMRGYKAIAA